MTYLSAAIAPPSPWIGRSCHLDRSRDLSDRCRHRRGDDRDAGAGADADADGIAICPIEKRPEASATMPPASERTVMILPPEPSRKSVNVLRAVSNVVSAPEIGRASCRERVCQYV